MIVTQMSHRTERVLVDIDDERVKQEVKWGPQSHPDGTSPDLYGVTARVYRTSCDKAFGEGVGTWRHILLEEVYESLSETDLDALREELVQVAAVACAWVEDIDRRTA